ncbi:hypothetical protein AVEN_199437-1 [Araneus ventricosus]|uniref:Uncharacterized protein n=1 Tax=Araneus ventricosus TaxID=182803 RepID=A0A4Y2M339_ARAVE|nr:hypothetical protein AVEN_199437-1 [Araneus ventricosus]
MTGGVVRSQDRRVPSSNPGSDEDPRFMWASCTLKQTFSFWCGAEVWSGSHRCHLLHLTSVQNYEFRINMVKSKTQSKALFQRSVACLLEVVFGDLLSFGIRPAPLFPRPIHNLQQPVGTVLRSPSIDSLAFDVQAFTDIPPERSSHPKNSQATTIPCGPTMRDKTYFEQETPNHLGLCPIFQSSSLIRERLTHDVYQASEDQKRQLEYPM